METAQVEPKVDERKPSVLTEPSRIPDLTPPSPVPRPRPRPRPAPAAIPQQEEALPQTEEELSVRRAAALRRWLEEELGSERTALSALLAGPGHSPTSHLNLRRSHH
jgi:hypothetical protein